MAVKTYSKNTNGKLGTDIHHFPIPFGEGICIGMTDLCFKICYNQKYHSMFQQDKTYLENFKLSLTDEFVSVMTDEIRFLYSNKIRKYYRIHTSGDFYNQSYLDKWYKIIRNNKNVTFLAYTRSYMLDFKGKPRNLKLFYSVDDTTTDYPKYKMPYAKLNSKANGKITILETTRKKQDTFICKSKCSSCKACFNPTNKMNVLFNEH